MSRNMTLALTALLVGCAAGATAQNIVLPIARGTTTKSFQHYCQKLRWGQLIDAQELVPELGKAGWELATFVPEASPPIACFKREISGS